MLEEPKSEPESNPANTNTATNPEPVSPHTEPQVCPSHSLCSLCWKSNNTCSEISRPDNQCFFVRVWHMSVWKQQSSLFVEVSSDIKSVYAGFYLLSFWASSLFALSWLPLQDYHDTNGGDNSMEENRCVDTHACFKGRCTCYSKFNGMRQDVNAIACHPADRCRPPRACGSSPSSWTAWSLGYLPAPLSTLSNFIPLVESRFVI